MSFDLFLKLDGITGESTDVKHKGEIEVLSYSFGLANDASGGSTGGASGTATFEGFHFVSHLQRSSPVLFQKCASGEHIKEAVLTARKVGDKQHEFYKLTFTDVVVSEFQQAGDADGDEAVPREQFGLNFGKIAVSYSPQKADGSLDTAVTASWDVKGNRK